MLNGVVLEWQKFRKQKFNDRDSDEELDLLELIFMQFDSSNVREQLVVFFLRSVHLTGILQVPLLIGPGKGWTSPLREIVKALKLNVATEFG